MDFLAKKSEPGQKSDATAPGEARRPVVCFALGKSLNIPQIEKQFRDEGMKLVFANTDEEVLAEIQKAECFVVFVGMEFGGNGIRLMQKNVPQTSAYWIMVSGPLSTQKRSQLLKAGATDLLHHPVSGAQYKLRAKGLLSRYLKSYDMPEDTILPEGVSRRDDSQTQRAVASNNGPNDSSGPQVRHSEGGVADQGRDYNHVRGEAGAGHQHNVHDLNGEHTEPQVGHVNSTDEAKAQWNNHAGPNETTKNWGSASAKDEAPAGWNNHASAVEKNAPPKSPIIISERKTPSSGFEGFASTHPAERKNKSDAPTGSAGPSARATATTVKVTPYDPAIPLDQVSEPLMLLEAIQRKLTLLRSDIPWDPSVWADCSRLLASPFKGMDNTVLDLQLLFRDACSTLEARRITLISYKMLLNLPECPEDLVCLVSSDADPRNNERIATQIMPHLRVAFDKAQPFFLDQKLPDRIDGHERPASWRVNGAVEKMSVIVPISTEARVSLALFVQFDKPIEESTRRLLDQAVTYLKGPERHYGFVDFLSRIYRDIKA